VLGYWSERVRVEDGPAVRTEEDARGAAQAEPASSEQGELKTSIEGKGKERERIELTTPFVNRQPSVLFSLLRTLPHTTFPP